MKAKLILIIVLTLVAKIGFGQTKADSLKTARVNYYTSQLEVPAKTATKIDDIMDAYKTEAKALMVKNADQKVLRAKFDSLITVKNQKLAAVLTKEQLAKVVPTTELKAATPQTAKKANQ